MEITLQDHICRHADSRKDRARGYKWSNKFIALIGHLIDLEIVIITEFTGVC